MSPVVHYAFDVGSTLKGNFGWARATKSDAGADVRGGVDVDVLVRSVETDLAAGALSLTFGVECPLFLPVPDNSKELSAGRIGDRDRSCFAPVGGYVATLGLHQFAFLLRKLRRERVSPTLDWRGWSPKPQVVLFWEAFVTGKAHSDAGDAAGHVRDAATAAASFDEGLVRAKAGGNPVRVPTGTSPLSLAGFALLWAGWSQDVSLLSQDALVVKPDRCFSGRIT